MNNPISTDPHMPRTPQPPYQLSVLHHAKDAQGQDRIKTIRLDGAGIAEVGHLASHLSRDNPWFVVIQDNTGAFQGAFLDGEYVESTTPDDEIIALAEAWQAMPAERPERQA